MNQKWLIERHIDSVTRYWNGRFLDDRGFVSNVNEAVGFANEQDGAIVLAWLLDRHGRVAQHVWSESALLGLSAG